MTTIYRFALWLDEIHPLAMLVFLAGMVVGLRAFEGMLVRRASVTRRGR